MSTETKLLLQSPMPSFFMVVAKVFTLLKLLVILIPLLAPNQENPSSGFFFSFLFDFLVEWISFYSLVNCTFFYSVLCFSLWGFLKFLDLISIVANF